MRILSFDPGATRAGWAVIDDGRLIASDVVHHPRLPNQKFQVYRMELTEFWAQEIWELLDEYKPGVVVTETVPSRGAGIPEQLYLANVMVTTVHTIALAEGVNCIQVSARTVQAHIAKRKEGVKITKVQVRNGVLERCPELKP